ncbi:MAG: IPTL-CTERM sorting domain-containing protein [Chitinophagales bacterium]
MSYIFKPKFSLFSLLMYFLLVGNTSYVLAQPANSALADAIEALSSPFNHTVTSTQSDAFAAQEPNENTCDNGFYNANWWYKITPNSAGTLTASATMIVPETKSSSNPTALGAGTSPSNPTALSVCVYTGNGFPLNEEGGQSSFIDNTINPTVSINVTPGTTYYISVGNSTIHTSIGDIVTTITFDSTASPASIPTLSEWGLIILALLLMTAGTLYLLQPNWRARLDASVEQSEQ